MIPDDCFTFLGVSLLIDVFGRIYLDGGYTTAIEFFV